ncbi:hypothetical protein KUTeg_008396 [Tegillarca granosa]|uniref:Uncharacterized protein n=1 Tax=Tegillarca granosa TaxID=220873 RepID=A0ABQ9F914_TEGGR|nr:hypothetical protein KUTeg_008396 [Tegillarca granosa]
MDMNTNTHSKGEFILFNSVDKTTPCLRAYEKEIAMKNSHTKSKTKEMDTNKTNQLNETEGKITSEIDQDGGESKPSFKTKLRHNKEYRTKFLYTVLIWAIFLVFGWKVAQIGPSLLDLKIITKTTLDKISGIFTSDAIGYLGGTILGGFLFRRFNSAILLFTSVIGSAFVIATIPWCSVFEAMVAIKMLLEVRMSNLLACDQCSLVYFYVRKGLHLRLANAELFRIWETDNAAIVQALHFFFTSKKQDDGLTEQPSFREKLPMLILVASLSITYIVVQESLFEFLSAFFVEQLNWTKTFASYLTSVFWATFALGRFGSIFLLRYIKSSHLLGITSSLLIIATFGIFISSLYIFNPGLWISVGLCGLSMSSMFPTIFTWTDSELLPVNAFITSLIFAAGASTSIINPIILGYLMDNVDKMAFCYFIVGGTISFIVISEEESMNIKEMEFPEQKETHNTKALLTGKASSKSNLKDGKLFGPKYAILIWFLQMLKSYFYVPNKVHWPVVIKIYRKQ